MISTRKLKKSAEHINRQIVKNIDNENESLWLKDNRNRILEISQNIVDEIPIIKLPKLFDEIRANALAREIVEQTDGIFNENTLDILCDFSLTFAEYSLLPALIKMNLLLLLSKALTDKNFIQYTDNAVKSLVNFNSIDFIKKEEDYLLQEQILLKNKDYCASDENTKSIYRKKIGKIAEQCNKSEEEIAKIAVNDLTDNLFFDEQNCSCLFWGIKNNFFGKKCNFKGRFWAYVLIPLLFTLILFCTIAFIKPDKIKIIFGIVSILPLFVCFVMINNRVILKNVPPRATFKLKSELADTIENKTAISVTVVVPDENSAKGFLTKIEGCFASNRIENGVYLILADLPLAKTKETEKDREIAELLENGISFLNKKYNNNFAFILRKRFLQGKEYFGRERKRGAIEDLVKYIKGETVDFLKVVNGESIRKCKYVLTLDGDTVLPPQSVKKLISVIVHPANKNYGLVQPNIGILPTKPTPFFRIMTDRWGIDSYNLPNSEIYSDLFSSGTFCGKGIFSVEKYYQKINGKIPDMTVLSHDILEGELIDTVNASDITLLDEFPDNAITFYKRKERWVRGDWQLLPWLKSDLKCISKWKILYNCIQSLFYVFVFLQVILSAFCKKLFVCGLSLSILELLLPTIFVYSDAILFDREKQVFCDKKIIRKNSFKRFLISFLMLPYEAFLSSVASTVALWRRLVTHKNTLKWNTFASSNTNGGTKEFYRFFASQVVLGVISLFVFCFFGHCFSGTVFAFLWIIAPYFMFRMGQTEIKNEETLFVDEVFALKLLKIRTQRFFYDALKENNFIMADNLQIKPYKGYAKRTSPTNIGFGILSVLCGIKSGEYPPSLAAEMLEKQLQFLENAQKYKGHLFNWYNTENKNVISSFISTVDSGNLCACLVATVSGAKDILKQNIISKKLCKAFADTISAFSEESEEDFSLRLENYANEFYSATEANGQELLKNFVDDKIVSEKVPYCAELAEKRLNDIESVSFSKELMFRCEPFPELYELLKKFPKNIQKILEYEDFKQKVNQALWSKNNCDNIKKCVFDEHCKIYGFAYEINAKVQNCIKIAEKFLDEIDFSFLYNEDKKLLSIGFNTETEKQSDNYYDMLCSEARLTSFFCIATGKIPAENWFNMARPFSRINNEPLCLSWSGTMFEYLMPNLFLPLREDSMLGITSKLAVEAQKKVKSKSGIWGISESAYNALDRTKEYKYKAFGVQKTATSSFKEEKVFSPYSTLLALKYSKREAMDNIIRLVENGMADKYGMFEAIDFSRTNGEKGEIVYSFMAHHSGMSLCALTNFLYSDYITNLFIKENYINASLVLMEEKVPIGVKPRKEFEIKDKSAFIDEKTYKREFLSPKLQFREKVLLKGENVSAFLDSKGNIEVYFGKKYVGKVSGYFLNNKKASAGFEPIKDLSLNYKTVFEPGKAEFVSENKENRFTLTIFATDNALLFNMQAENLTKEKQTIEFVFLVETVLEYKDVFSAHPAFNGLFIQCEQTENGVKSFNRRSLASSYIYSLNEIDSVGTDRFFAIGRGRDNSNPLLELSFKKYPISPCSAINKKVIIQVGESKSVSFVVGKDTSILNKASFDLHCSKAQNNAMAVISSFGITREMWKLSLILLAKINERCVNISAEPDVLWRYGISENKPLLGISVSKNRKNTEILLKICNYLFYLGVDFNLILIEDSPEDYLNREFEFTERMIENLNNRESIFHIRLDRPEETEKIKSFSFAFFDFENDLYEEIKPETKKLPIEKIIPKENIYSPSVNAIPNGYSDNGYGMFTESGEYYIYSRTPSPWANVVSFNNIGFISTESGGGYSFYKNSALNKLTGRCNDAVTDRQSEVLYVKDNDLNRFWSITRDPVDLGDEHDTLFGQGYTGYGYNGFGIKQQQTVFIHSELPIKIITVEMDEIKNRDIDLFYYLSPKMCEQENESQKFLEVVEIEGIPCVKNNNEYMFIYAENCKFNVCEDEFIAGGEIRQPYGVKYDFAENKENKQGKICLSLKTKAKKQTDIFLCVGENQQQIKEYIKKIKQMDTLYERQRTVEKFKDITSKIKIFTPDKKLDMLFNNWLMYQVVSSRMNGRCGYYQAGGAYGFRDQLQDCIALLKVQPNIVREHILRCCRHQFSRGDVQHWWHEKYKGVRTNISDDLLFLPFICAKYITATGDNEILKEVVPFLEGHSLNGKTDVYEEAWQSKESATVYIHCMRAVKLVLRRSGKHFLPLILDGDWNDGMNKIGNKGKGESVWLGWFLYGVISEFLPYCQQEDKELLLNHAKKLYDSLNTFAWDGKWYLRAFDDSGKPVGSSKNKECQIDSVSQSWAVLSGAGKNEMCKTAIESAYKMLVDSDKKTVKLLTPPIDKNLGYIGDYIPGIRENGGQYTHAGVWLASAFAQLGESEKCYEILNMLNPINHSFDKKSAENYKIEPYVLAGDVYSNEEWEGRGGWSWYTGSASLYFDAVLSDLLGIKVENGNITVDPHIPSNWGEYKVYLENEQTEIKVINPNRKTFGVSSVSVVEKEGKKEIRVVM